MSKRVEFSYDCREAECFALFKQFKQRFRRKISFVEYDRGNGHERFRSMRTLSCRCSVAVVLVEEIGDYAAHASVMVGIAGFLLHTDDMSIYREILIADGVDISDIVRGNEGQYRERYIDYVGELIVSGRRYVTILHALTVLLNQQKSTLQQIVTEQPINMVRNNHLGLHYSSRDKFGLVSKIVSLLRPVILLGGRAWPEEAWARSGKTLLNLSLMVPGFVLFGHCSDNHFPAKYLYALMGIIQQNGLGADILARTLNLCAIRTSPLPDKSKYVTIFSQKNMLVQIFLYVRHSAMSSTRLRDFLPVATMFKELRRNTELKAPLSSSFFAKKYSLDEVVSVCEKYVESKESQLALSKNTLQAPSNAITNDML